MNRNLLSNKLSVDKDFMELFLRFFSLPNSSLNILSATELLLAFSEIDPFLDNVGLLLPLLGDEGLAAAMLSVLKLKVLPRNDVAVDAMEIRSP